MNSSLEGQFEQIMDLLGQSPTDHMLIEDDFGTVLVETKEELIREKKYEEVLQLVKTTSQVIPTFYAKEFPYLSNFAVEYYLYKREMEKARLHLQPFVQDPATGFDLFIPLLNKIRFYNLNDVAFKLSHDMYQPIADSDRLISGAEDELVEAAFYYLIQEYYVSLKNGQRPSWDELTATLQQYGYDDYIVKTEFPRFQQNLANLATHNKRVAYNKTEWTEQSQEYHNTYRDLFWSFAVYMLEQRDISFDISADIWFQFSKVLYQKKTWSTFSFQLSSLESTVQKTLHPFYSTEDDSAFSLVWGTPFIYDFLREHQLANDEAIRKSLQHIQAVKKQLMKRNREDLWRFTFVHEWGRPTIIPEEEFLKEREIFHQSFTAPPKRRTTPPLKTVKESDQLSLLGQLLGHDSKPTHKSSSKNVAKNKKKRNQAKKQRRKNR